MKKLIISTILLGLSSTTSWAGEGFYASVGVGLNSSKMSTSGAPQGWPFPIDGPTVEQTAGALKFGHGDVTFPIAIGYDFDPIRLEVEYKNSTSSNDFSNKFPVVGTGNSIISADEKLKIQNLHFKALYDVEFSNKIQPFFGVGAGVSKLDGGSYRVAVSQGGPNYIYSSKGLDDYVFSYSFHAGLKYNITESVFALVELEHIRYLEQNEIARIVRPSQVEFNPNIRYSNNLMMKIGYSF